MRQPTNETEEVPEPPLRDEAIMDMAKLYGLDCDYVEPKFCAFRGTDRCCQREARENGK